MRVCKVFYTYTHNRNDSDPPPRRLELRDRGRGQEHGAHGEPRRRETRGPVPAPVRGRAVGAAPRVRGADAPTGRSGARGAVPRGGGRKRRDKWPSVQGDAPAD